MATLGFQVHTDKENETPAILRPIDRNLHGKSLQSFPIKGGTKLTQPTPRKALGSVNNQLSSVPSSHGIKGRAPDFQQGPVQALFKPKKSVGDENLPAGHFSKKPKAKGSPGIRTGLKKPLGHVRSSKTKTPKSKPRPVVEPIPVIPDDVEYDSDTILPHSERLSCYVDKLLTWRPPCLFGTFPDSDSDIEDVVVEDLDDIIQLDPPSFSLFDDDQELPQDLSELLVDLPSLSPPHPCSESPQIRNISPDLFPLNDQSLDSSLHLGQLHFGAMTPEPSLEPEPAADSSIDSHSFSSDG